MFGRGKDKEKDDQKPEDVVYDALKPVAHALGRAVRELFLQVTITADNVTVVMDFGQNPPSNPDAVKEDVEEIVKGLPKVSTVTVIMTASKPIESQASAPEGTPDSVPSKPAAGGRPAPPKPKALPGVKHIIAVASGKGGVGKSTTAINLTLAFSSMGLKAGILDADIFGPSIPKLTNTQGQKPQSSQAGKILPVESMGIKAISIGHMIDATAPIVWRGPRLMGAIGQLINDVDWDDLDILVVDLPPGTGDVQLTLVQQATLAGAVIVSTPQDLALIDARKGIEMFKKTETPILGIIENMSYFLCPSCGDQSDIFGHGGARETSAALGIDFLGEIPLHMNIRATADAGNPVVNGRPMSKEAGIYREIAEKITKSLGI